MSRHFLLFLGIVVLAWLLGVDAGAFTIETSADAWRLRRTMLFGTGILGIACMSAAMILAARPAHLEKRLGGLDQCYRLHKRLGIAGALFGLSHWLIEIVPRWMVRQGWLDRPVRPRHPDVEPTLLAALENAAPGVGEWGLYIVLALVLVALWKRIPYRQFHRLHRLLPIAYLMLVFHSVLLMPANHWKAISGPLAAVLMAGGAVAAALSLMGRIGFKRRALGHVTAVRLHDDRVLEVHCRLDTPWEGHESGQFVFVTFDPKEGAHPFTVASAWKGDGAIVLAIKGLGDYTRKLPALLTLGAGAVIEGPYGCFNFAGGRNRQIWVAGGIGITPFISRMERLAQGGTERQPVDLFYSTSEADDALFGLLRTLAGKTGVALHTIVTHGDGLLTPERLAQAVPQYAEADVWFCGPKKFGDAMRKGLRKLGVPAGHFHQEAFEMR